jgi:hypothetical protein
VAALERGAPIERIDLGAAQRALAAARRAAPAELDAALAHAQSVVSGVAEAHA